MGGGSDLPQYYREYGVGKVVGAAIDKYVYVSLNKPLEDHVMIHYRRTERVQRVSGVLHDRIRECLLAAGIDRQIEVASIADIPGNTGLGSSSAFTVGLLHAIEVMKHGPFRREHGLWRSGLAQRAITIEQHQCGDPIGDQDQYLTSEGGMRLVQFRKDDRYSQSVRVDPSFWNHIVLIRLDETSRNAGTLLRSIVTPESSPYIGKMVDLVDPFVKAVEQKEWRACGAILHEAWMIKRELKGVTSTTIDALYTASMGMRGIWGGKLCGAGGGGFLLLFGHPEGITEIERFSKFPTMRVQPDYDGTTLIYDSSQHHN